MENLSGVLVGPEIDSVGGSISEDGDGQALIDTPDPSLSQDAPSHAQRATADGVAVLAHRRLQLETDLDELDGAQKEALQGAGSYSGESHTLQWRRIVYALTSGVEGFG